jgi:hypothetical protein
MVVQARRILSDSALRERLAANALQRAQALGWRHTVERTLAVLEERLAASSRPRKVAVTRVPAPAVADSGDGTSVAPGAAERK